MGAGWRIYGPANGRGRVDAWAYVDNRAVVGVHARGPVSAYACIWVRASARASISGRLGPPAGTSALAWRARGRGRKGAWASARASALARRRCITWYVMGLWWPFARLNRVCTPSSWDINFRVHGRDGAASRRFRCFATSIRKGCVVQRFVLLGSALRSELGPHSAQWKGSRRRSGWYTKGL